MGYRSEVRCLIYGTKEQMNTFLVAHQIALNTPVFSHFKENLTRYTIKTAAETTLDVLDLQGDAWKWYDAYEDVKAWQEFMLDAPNWGLQYEFIRIGEGDGSPDVERMATDDSECLLYITTPMIGEDFDKGETISLF